MLGSSGFGRHRRLKNQAQLRNRRREVASKPSLRRALNGATHLKVATLRARVLHRVLTLRIVFIASVFHRDWCSFVNFALKSAHPLHVLFGAAPFPALSQSVNGKHGKPGLRKKKKYGGGGVHKSVDLVRSALCKKPIKKRASMHVYRMHASMPVYTCVYKCSCVRHGTNRFFARSHLR